MDKGNFWKLTEPDKVVTIIRAMGCSTLGNWDGCCCSRFSIRNVDVEISCGKGGEQAVRVSSPSLDYSKGEWGEGHSLEPILAEVVQQVTEQSGRGGTFAQYIDGERQLPGVGLSRHRSTRLPNPPGTTHTW